MKTNQLLIALVLIAAVLLAGCGSPLRVGPLQTESQSIDLGDEESVSVEINLGAGNLELTGGSDELLEADFTYNVARLKPEVGYTGGTIVVQQPEVKGLPALQGITEFQNEWDLQLNDNVPMDLRVDVGGGTGDLRLSGLSLTGLNVSLGAGESTIDLSGEWAHDLDVTIDAGAAFVTVLLPREVGVRVRVEPGPHTIEATDLTQDGDVYTNAAYGVSEVTLQIYLEAGIGQIYLEVEEAAALPDDSADTGEFSQLIQTTVEEAAITGQWTIFVQIKGE